MKKIMFNDRYGLTKAVLEGRKTMTRRMVPIGLYNQTDWKAVREGNYEAVSDGEGNWHDVRLCGQYQIGEEVAVAQSYSSIEREIEKEGLPLNIKDEFRKHKGWTNKMFVRADLMPHRIRIINIRMERLQDISDEDCTREGIQSDTVHYQEWRLQYGFRDKNVPLLFGSRREAFASLITKVGKKSDWEDNPWVFVYEFKLVK